MKILTVFDPHISHANPANRIDDYFQTCLRKLEEIKNISEKNNCQVVLFSGDMYHHKSWMKNPYAMTYALAELFKSFKVPVKTIYGNHDLSAGYDESSIERQPLGMLCMAANIELLRKDKEYWLDEETALTCTPFFADIDKHIESYKPKRVSKAKVHIHLTHGSLIPKKPIWDGYTLYKDVEGSKADWILNGHLHPNYGVVKVGETNIANCGSLTRATLSDDDLKRKPSVFLLDTKTNAHKIIELKSALPPEKCFNLDKIEKQEKAEIEIDKLGDLIKQEASEIEINSLDGIKQLVRDSKSIDNEVKNVCYELLDKSEEFV